MNPTLKIQKDLSHFKIGLILFFIPKWSLKSKERDYSRTKIASEKALPISIDKCILEMGK